MLPIPTDIKAVPGSKIQSEFRYSSCEVSVVSKIADLNSVNSGLYSGPNVRSQVSKPFSEMVPAIRCDIANNSYHKNNCSPLATTAANMKRHDKR